MMSKEAKIGLLFSLVFIVAIAVILRSVHEDTVDSFDSSKIMHVEKTMPSTNDLSSTVKALTEDIDNHRQGQQSGSTPPTTNSQYQNTAANVQPNNDNPVNNRQPVRFSLPLPGSNADNSSTVVTVPPTGEIEKAIKEIDNNEFNISSEAYAQYQKIRSQIEQAHGITRNPQTATTTGNTVKETIHTVKEGENLTEVAMRYYGKKEGNRLVNIEKIFEANKDILSSINSVKVGQRLRIPAIAGMVSNEAAATSASNATSKSSGGKVYKVKEDDSLWKIAAHELGNGTRYQEILKLNSRTLKNADSLTVGMKLILPAK